MLITTGKVNNGVIQIDSNDLPDGTTVTLLAHEGDETFELDPVQESELLAANRRRTSRSPLPYSHRFGYNQIPLKPMYCPNCGQQQVSEEMRFCSRCGLALSGLAEWLAGGRLPAKPDEAQAPNPLSPRRKGIRRAAKLMFFSGVLFPIFLLFSLAVEEGGPMIIPFGLFFISLVMMLYARLFSDKTAPVLNQAAQTSALGSNLARSALSPANTTSMPGVGRQHVRTNELAQPPSVTENTTRLLDNE